MKDGYLTRGKKRDMSVTWPALSSGRHLLRTPHIFGAHKKNEPFTAAHFLTIKALQRKKWKAQTLESYPHEYLPVFFFPSLYPPVDSLSDSYKTHPSLASIRLSLNWLEITSMTLSSKLKAYNIKQSDRRIIQVEEGKAPSPLKVRG